ncbi:MAG: hypothetical protein SH856_01490 [Flavobacteriales bacterium]|nr:hypothetical protein [Flavobacteriales bacterium]
MDSIDKTLVAIGRTLVSIAKALVSIGVTHVYSKTLAPIKEFLFLADFLYLFCGRQEIFGGNHTTYCFLFQCKPRILSYSSVFLSSSCVLL